MCVFFFSKQKTAYELRISDCSSDVCSSDLLGVRDARGFIRFVGRNDDVITSAGYRIGPAPIEDCLIGHPAVRMAAVVGVPDEQRTEIVMAYVVLNDGFDRSEERRVGTGCVTQCRSRG